MAKATVKSIITPTDGALGAHTRPGSRTMGIQVSLSSKDGAVTLRSRTPTKKTPSPAQTEQRAKYSDCDCLWKFREPPQVEQWEKYTGTAKKNKKGVSDSYRLFMAGCLRFDLSTYLINYLFADWKLDTIEPTASGYMVTVHMGSLIEQTIPAPWWEPDTLQNRLI